MSNQIRRDLGRRQMAHLPILVRGVGGDEHRFERQGGAVVEVRRAGPDAEERRRVDAGERAAKALVGVRLQGADVVKKRLLGAAGPLGDD